MSPKPHHLPKPKHPLSQRGFMSKRALAILGVLVGVLLIPVWWNKGDKKPGANTSAGRQNGVTINPIDAKSGATTPPNAGIAAASATPSANAAPATTAPNAAAAYNPNGMSWGFLTRIDLPSNALWPSCHGDPRPGFDAAHNESCNPFQGDTSCRTALPILCIQKDGIPATVALGPNIATGLTKADDQTVTDAWADGAIASTEPVAGFVLDSQAAASARCEKELGKGWRMAEFKDGIGGQTGWGFIAKKGGRVLPSLRHWVYSNDQKAHCWDTQ